MVTRCTHGTNDYFLNYSLEGSEHRKEGEKGTCRMVEILDDRLVSSRDGCSSNIHALTSDKLAVVVVVVEVAVALVDS